MDPGASHAGALQGDRDIHRDGRNGRTESEDGLLAVEVRIPKEMGGPGGATNSEQLFAAQNPLHIGAPAAAQGSQEPDAPPRVNASNGDHGPVIPPGRSIGMRSISAGRM